MHHLLEALDAEYFSGGGRQQDDVGLGCNRVRPLDVERNLEAPKVVRLESGSVVRRRRDGRGPTLDLDDVEPRLTGRRTVARRIGGAGFSAEVVEAERGIENPEVLPDRRASEGIDDRDRLAEATIVQAVGGRDVIRIADRRRIEAPAADRVARGLARAAGRRRT